MKSSSKKVTRVKKHNVKHHSKTRKNRKTQSNQKSIKRIFTRKQYNSGDGMLTSVWGPSMWHYLHTVSFNYPVRPTPEDKQKYKELILNMRYTLPCKYCRINLRKNLKDHPIRPCHLKDRESYSKYVYQLHELVNKMLGKKSGLSYCDARERYEHFRARCTETNKLKTMRHLKNAKKNKSASAKNGTGKNKTQKKRESGCTEPLYGKKAKCVIHIVPNDKKCKTFNIDDKCVKKKL